jgi:hypothetical protein
VCNFGRACQYWIYARFANVDLELELGLAVGPKIETHRAGFIMPELANIPLVVVLPTLTSCVARICRF